MQKLLIAERSEELAAALVQMLQADYEVYTCSRGDKAVSLLEALRPDALILDLSLPCLDGLSVLWQTVYTPPIILALTKVSAPYVLQAAKDAGVGYALLIPCTVRVIVKHLKEMLRVAALPDTAPDPQQITADLLDTLGISPNHDGYRQLRVGVPLFAQDPGQPLMKELYPAIAAICGNDNGSQVERSIRAAIRVAWKVRDRDIWETYFPNRRQPPSNKRFLCALEKRL